jgi:assimilatory nitrate reductase catalytic subunit
MMIVFSQGTPLCPAGHLPRKGGDQPTASLSPITDVAGWAARLKLPISPLAGEMSGRTEEGATDRDENRGRTHA